MNKYAAQISERWQKTAPTRYAALPDPESFFQEQGELTLARVNELVEMTSSTQSPQESYLNTVGRLTVALRQAEEIAMSELEWPETELSSTEERDEWESSEPPADALETWAWSWEETPPEDVLEVQAEQWMLDPDFLREMATAENPSTFSAEHSVEIASAKERRFQRYLQTR